MQRFNWDDLRFLLAISRGGSVSAASRALSVDHATVIRRLEGLERALNAKLFQRNVRGYSLTTTGEQLLLSAKTMEDEATRASTQLGDGRMAVTGGLRISNFFLARRLAAFGSAHPDVSIDLITLQQLVALSRREADIAITLHPPVTGRFHITRLTDYVLQVHGSRDYLARCAPIASRGDFADHPFAGYIDDLVFMRELNYLDAIGARVRPRLQSSSIHAQLEYVRQGYGLCVLPRFVAQASPDLVPVRPDLFTLRRSYWIVADPEIMQTARAKLLVAYLEAEVAAAQALFIGDPMPADD